MNKRAEGAGVGLLLFIIALAFFAFYCFFVYIPALQKDISNSNAVVSAIWVGLVCGILGTIGVVLARQ